MSTLSTHVLDTARGRPAAGIRVTLEHEGSEIASAVTDADGRVREFQPKGSTLRDGRYTLRFAIAEYYGMDVRACFYPQISIEFCVAGGAEHYHVPLLLSPFGYSTYRGS